MSGWRRSSHASSRGRRVRIEFTFQVAIFTPKNVAARGGWLLEWRREGRMADRFSTRLRGEMARWIRDGLVTAGQGGAHPPPHPAPAALFTPPLAPVLL